MTERERLIDLITEANIRLFNSGESFADFIADYLLSNGVIVPPVKLGERRIDDLGRILIPKDIRQPLEINYGDVISISVSDACIILRKEREQK